MQATRCHNPSSVPFPRSPLFLMLSYLGKISLSGETVLLKAKDYILFNPKSPLCLVYKRWPINHRINAVTVKPITTESGLRLRESKRHCSRSPGLIG